MLRIIDRISYWIATAWTPVRQARTGVIMSLSSVLVVVYLPFSDEPPAVFLMSAAALLFGGLGVVVTAVLAIQNDPDADPEDLQP